MQNNPNSYQNLVQRGQHETLLPCTDYSICRSSGSATFCWDCNCNHTNLPLPLIIGAWRIIVIQQWILLKCKNLAD